MRHAFVCLGFATLAAVLPAAVVAAPGLRSTMHSWRANARTLQSMVSGRTTFDENAVRAALQAYAGEAGQLGGRVNGRTASAQSFKRHLAGFQADAQRALGDVTQRPALKADFSRLMSDCQSCHDAFRN